MPPPAAAPYSVAIVGGGLVGLAVARAIALRFPSASIALLERSASLGSGQSSHNSGVVHSGVYYKEGSLRAALCVRGHQALCEYADRHRIAYQIVGKVRRRQG
jgi:L-2-hydroxyglutarate oxidase LhgO